jgi:hypothetical protein
MTSGGAPKKKLATKHVVPAGSFMLRRVFRQGDSYTCGICRRGHGSVDEANTCLDSCWKLLLHRAPWMPVKRIGKLQFACIYCQRGYGNAAEATACAEHCKSNMTITGLDGTDLTLKKTKRNFAKSTMKPVVNFAFKIGGPNGYDPRGNSRASEEGTVDAAKAVVTEAAPVKEAPAAPTKEEPKKDEKDPSVRDRTKKYIREGSKYVCVNCQKKYFERVEAERCFDAHTGGSMDAHQNSGV